MTAEDGVKQCLGRPWMLREGYLRCSVRSRQPGLLEADEEGSSKVQDFLCKFLITDHSCHCMHSRLLVLMAGGGGTRQQRKAQQVSGAWSCVYALVHRHERI